ncbi:helix-turn-helix transcriptional regulator [Serratia fonticola]|uniref:helix-turn-helix transcriptional regulator n=1 Tax=Serratia fonticola TaxID=47917 RepID=UPI00192CC95C|nr:LuxR C-terminal-related transcriptional regulator [Serratia fonticola]MBL5906302.1 response regulator transcription factor [Serratia fonticola]
MKETLEISIVDDNQYFTSGLRHLLADFYLTKNTRVKFIDEKASKPSIDILFHANRHGIPGVYYRYLHSTAKPLVFAICDKNEKCHVRKDGILYRHQSMNLVLNMVEQARSIDHQSSCSASQTITHREYEVLGYLQQGRSLTEVAYYMNLSVKTVSAHKRSAMKRLNFRRNSELLYWMLQGGLMGHRKVMR